MRIVQLEALLVRGQFTKPYVTALDPKGMRDFDSVVLRMVTDEGLVGLGESNPYPAFTSETPETVMGLIQRRLGPAVLGLDPCNLVALHARMKAVLQGNPFARAPLDVAAYDILGQALGVPVYQLLGGRVRDRVPMIWPIGGGSPEENAVEAQARRAEGYGSFHVKVGALSPDTDVARVRAIREAVGPTVPIMIDANQGWDRAGAIRTIRRLAEYEPSMVEQPVPRWDVAGMAQVQAAVSIPISADEALDSPQQAVELLTADAARVFSLKTGKCGGLLPTRQVAAIAEAASVSCFVNSMIEMGISVAASLHLAVAVPNLVPGHGPVEHGHSLMSNLRITEDIVTPGCFRYEGRDMLAPTDARGLGITLDPEILERRTVERFVVS